MAGEHTVFNLYIGNHGKADGIEDYIQIIGKTLADRGHILQISPVLVPGTINLVIDEFTNFRENRRIAQFKKDHPHSPLVFVLTEFVERRFGVESFNLFGGLRDTSVVALLNVYLRSTRADFRRAKFLDFVKAVVFSPVLAFSPVMLAHALSDSLKFVAGRLLGRGSANPIQRFLKRHYRALYFHCRYLGLQSCLQYADAVIASHGKILARLPQGAGSKAKPVRSLGVLYPEFEVESVLAGLMSGKQLFLEMTGTITGYRRACIRRVDRAISSLGMGQVFGHCRSFPFASTGMQVVLERGAYSLHPPQSPDWRYCSPMRIFRALAVEGNLPVLMKRFAQHPIEEVCFVWVDKYSIVDLYDMYHDRRSTFEIIDGRLQQYNQVVRMRNDDCIRGLAGLGRIPDAVIASNGVSAPEKVDRFALGEVDQPTMLPID